MKKSLLSKMLLASMMMIGTQTALASSSIVNCEYTTTYNNQYGSHTDTLSSKCRFTLMRGGSFTLTSLRPRTDALFPETSIDKITVQVIGKNIAHVYEHGEEIDDKPATVFLGKARNIKYHGCWEGSDFRVCAWK